MKEMKRRVMREIALEAIGFAIILLVSVSPLITAYVQHLDFNEEMTSPYLNGLITAIGVFLAIVSTVVLSKSECLTTFQYNLARISMFAFIVAMVYTANTLVIKNSLTRNELLVICFALNLSAITAFILIPSIYRKNIERAIS
jgi:hypothetical protein